MKTIDEIINNENYKKFKEECIKLDLDDYDSFKLGDCIFKIGKVKCNSGYYQYNLYMYTERDLVAIDEKLSYYYMNDFSQTLMQKNKIGANLSNQH